MGVWKQHLEFPREESLRDIKRRAGVHGFTSTGIDDFLHADRFKAYVWYYERGVRALNVHRLHHSTHMNAWRHFVEPFWGQPFPFENKAFGIGPPRDEHRDLSYDRYVRDRESKKARLELGEAAPAPNHATPILPANRPQPVQNPKRYQPVQSAPAPQHPQGISKKRKRNRRNRHRRGSNATSQVKLEPGRHQSLANYHLRLQQA
jgi:hypothetical protein